MKKEESVEARAGKPDAQERQPQSFRLPGFLLEEDIGLGDVIKRGTSAVGIKPCGGCLRRAEALNRWLTFKGRRSG